MRLLCAELIILGFRLVDFSKVEFNQNENPTNTNEIDINIEVEESSTGEFSLGGGYSSGNGPQATIGLSENNFLMLK